MLLIVRDDLKKKDLIWSFAKLGPPLENLEIVFLVNPNFHDSLTLGIPFHGGGGGSHVAFISLRRIATT